MLDCYGDHKIHELSKVSQMNFFVLAIDHTWQLVAPRGDPSKAFEAKARLETILTQIIENEDVEIICEESDPSLLSIAQKIAFEHSPRLTWKNIMMSSQERLEAGIWQALVNRPIDVSLRDDGVRTVEHRIPEDNIIEEFFIDKSVHAADAVCANSILVLCGDLHLDSLGEKLITKKYKVTMNRDLVPEKHWK